MESALIEYGFELHRHSRKCFLSLCRRLTSCQYFEICHLPLATTLVSPPDNETELSNKAVVLEWQKFTSEMVGTPCSSNSPTPVIFVVLDPAEVLDPRTHDPVTVVMNMTTTSITQSDPIGTAL